MQERNETVLECIERLAVLSYAPDSFVDEVKKTFLEKGVDLEADVEPYYEALIEAFDRQLRIRVGVVARRMGVRSYSKKLNRADDDRSYYPVVPGPEEEQ